MHPAARLFLGVFALWTMLKTPLFLMLAEQTRRHLDDANVEVRRTLRNRAIGSYGNALMTLTIAVITATLAITGGQSLKTWVPLLVGIVAAGIICAGFGVKGAFDSLHNPGIKDFDRRFGIAPLRFFRRGRSPEGPTAGGS